MKYFDTYCSGTLAASGSQSHFTSEEYQTGRIYYKVFSGGTYNWSLLFANIMDSTFSDGSFSHVNQLGGEWELRDASICITDGFTADSVALCEPMPLTFGGSCIKAVMPGEYFVTDPVALTAEKDQFICLEMTFRGERIPYHPETCISSYRKQGDAWEWNTAVPFPSHVGCDRRVSARIGYIGDSITQGCGTARDSYTNWSAVLSEMLGEKYSYWNLGLGYSRAMDAATDSSWLYKAKHVDAITVCFGVNDMFQGQTAEQIKADLTSIVKRLHDAGVKVLLQTVPPFGYSGSTLEMWKDVNTYICDVLSKEADAFFDNNPTLSASDDEPEIARFGGHPNAEGCLEWAKALYPVMTEFVKALN